MNQRGILNAVGAVARRTLEVPAGVELTGSTVLTEVVKIDSVQLIEFVGRLEEELGIEFDVEQLSGPAVLDLGRLVPMIAELLPPAGPESPDAASDAVVFGVADPADAEQIVKLQYLCYQSEAERYQNYAIAPLTQSADSMRAEIAETTVLVARLGTEVVASVRGREQDGTCHIGRLVTHPRLRGQGIGGRLLREIEEHFPAARRFELFTGAESEDSRRLYTRNGYRECRSATREGVEMVVLDKPGAGAAETADR